MGSDTIDREQLEREVEQLLKEPEALVEDKLTFLEKDEDNPQLYALLCDRLGRTPQNPALYARGIVGVMDFRLDGALDTGVLLCEAPPRYGIELTFLSQLNEKALVAVFRGMYNLDMSDNILSHLNPDEIIAKYFAAGVLKYRNAHKTDGTTNDTCRYAIDNPMDLIRTLDREAYPKIGTIIRKWQARFKEIPGEQMRRMSEVPEEELCRAVYSFTKEYKSPCITPREKTKDNLAILILNCFEVKYNYSV